MTAPNHPHRTSQVWLTILVLTVALASAASISSLFKASAKLNPSRSDKTASARSARTVENYGQLPLSFETNEGQTDRRVKFMSRGNGYSLFLTPDQVVMRLRRTTGGTAETVGSKKSITMDSASASNDDTAKILSFKLVNSRRDPRISGEGELPGKTNYFIGTDPKNWRTNIPNYSKIRYSGIYRGIDLTYYGNQTQLEYDFVVSPQTDPRAIGLSFAGAEKIEISDRGDLVLNVDGEKITQHRPIVYQEIEGQRREIAGDYELRNGKTVGFRIGEYDRTIPLIIDPVLVYSTYMGGSAGDQGLAIAVDHSGNAYVTGSTHSINFPGAQPQGIQSTTGDAFVTKLNAAGNAILYSTYIGGNSSDSGRAIVVDGSNRAFIAGTTFSADFPTTTGAYQTSNHANTNNAFVTRLSASGSSLDYSTYIGGTENDFANALAVDASGNAYVAGVANSSDFPVGNAFQSSKSGASSLFKSTNASSTWSSGNNGLTAYQVNSVVIDPSNASIRYAASSRGVFKSTDGGANWVAANNGIPTLKGQPAPIRRILIDPSAPSTLYACSNVGFSNTIGVFKTTNGGSSWTTINSGLTDLVVNTLALDPSSAGTVLYAGADSGVFKSSNSGATWTLSNNGLSGRQIIDLVAGPSQVVFAGTDLGVFKTVDGGANWVNVLDDQNFTDVFWVVVIDPTSPSTVYAGTDYGLYKSTDGGTNWTRQNEQNGLSIPGITPGPNNVAAILSVAIDPTAPGTIYAGSREAGVYKTTNGGNTWTNSSSGLVSREVDSIAIDPTSPAALTLATNSGPDAFISKLNSNGSALLYSTYLGGQTFEQANAVAIDAAGNAYLTGYTNSTNFPTSNAFQGTLHGYDNAFITKLNSSGSPIFSTYLGGTGGFDIGRGIAVDGQGNVFIGGQTQSADFPIANALQDSLAGNTDGFITKLAPNGSSLIYSTFGGGSGGDQVNGIAIDAVGNAYVIGQTNSSDFPVVNPTQGVLGGGTDAFVAKINATGTAADYSTYLGGSDLEIGKGIACGLGGEVYVTGVTNSTNFPLANALQGSLGGGNDAFVTKIASTRSATDVTWINVEVGGNWNVASNWQDGTGANRVPTASDNVFIDQPGNYTVALNIASTVNSLTMGGASGTQTLAINGNTLTLNGPSTIIPGGVLNLNGGTLNGAGNLAVIGTFNWTNGIMGGSGVTTIASGATFTLAGSQPRLERTIDNSANVVLTSTSSLFINGGTFNNQSGALFNVQVDAGIFQSQPGTFNNVGTFRKSSSNGTSSLSLTFNNSGTVEVQSGTLNFASGGSHSGAFNVTNGATLQFGGGTHTLSATSSVNATSSNVSLGGTVVNLAGSYNVTGTTTVTGGTSTFTGNVTNVGNILNVSGAAVFNSNAVTIPTLNLTSGSLAGTANFTIPATGTFNWTNGIMGGSGVTTVASGATFTIAGSQPRLERTINNSANVALTSTSSLFVNGGTFNNQSGALFNVQIDAGIFQSQPGTFNNAGTFRKSSSNGTSNISLTFNNSGTVEVQSGTLNLGSGGTHTGAFNVTNGATLQFGGGTHTLSASSAISATGSNVTLGGTTVNLSGTYNVTGTTTINSGTSTFTGNVTNVGNILNVSGAAVFNSNAINIPTLNLTSGSLAGTANFTIPATGTFNWTNGIMGGTGVTTIASGATFTLAGSQPRLERTINNSTNVALTSASSLFVNGGTFNNQSGAVFDIQTSSSGIFQSQPGVFNNAGTFRKTTAAGTSAISLPFNNTGTVEVQIGTLSFNTGGAHTGSFTATNGSTLHFGGGTHTFSATSSITAPNSTVVLSATDTFNGSYNVTGTTTIDSGTQTFNGTIASIGTLNLSSGTLNGSATLNIPATGTMNWTNGIMGGTGVTNVAAGATFTLAGSQPRLERTLNNSANAVLTSASSFFINGGTFNNQSGAVFDVRVDAGIFQSQPGTFNNIGTFRKSVTTGTSSINLTFNNSGTVDVQTGTLAFNTGGSHTGSFTASNSSTLQFNSGTHTFSATSTVSSASGNVVLTATDTFAGTYNVSGQTTINGGTQTFNGNVLSLGTFNLSNGTLNGSSNINIQSGETFNWTNGIMGGSGVTTVASGATFTLAGTQPRLERTLNNSASVVLNSTSGFFINGGTFNNQSAGIFDVQSNSAIFQSQPGTFHNAGTFRKTNASNTTTVSLPFANTGTVEIQTGLLIFQNTYLQTAGTTILNGGALTKTGTALDIQGGTLQGTGTVTGTVSNGGTVSPGASPGCLNINGNYTQTATGVLNIEIGGLTPCSLFDSLVVSGSATLAGTLNATLVNEFTPGPNDSFGVMSFASRNGTFGTVNGPLSANYSATGVALGQGAPATTFTISGRVVDNSNAPLPNVTITLSGSQSATTTTTSDGDYTITGLVAGGNFTVTPSLTNFTFTPPSQTFNNLGSNQSANFTGTPSGPGVNNYAISQTTNGVIVPGDTDIGNHCDDCTTQVTLPFPVSLYDRVFSTAHISSNGVIQFSGNSTVFSNSCLPTSDTNFDYTILGYWDDLRTDEPNIPGLGRSGIFTSVSGTAPNRILNVEWRSTFYNNNNQAINFEIRLFENQARFDVIYAQIDQFGSSATIGVQRTLSSGFTQYECNTGGLVSGLDLSFTGSDQLFISGIVTQSNGAGIAGVTVNLSGPTNGTATTDSSGFYSFSNLTIGGNYTVTPSRTNFAFTPPSRTFNNLITNQQANFIGSGSNLAISGQVTDTATGAGLPNVSMALTGSQSATAVTDGNGNYAFQNLVAGGNYTVTPSRANFTFTPPNRTFNNLVSDQPANFVGSGVVTNFSITGQITNTASGEGVPGIPLALTGSQSASTVTDSSGNYAFQNLAAGGNYTVTPSLQNVVFNPPSRTFNNLSSNQVGNFAATQQESVATPVGTNVMVQLEDILVNFANVITAGTTTLRHISLTEAGTPPAGYTFFDTEGIDLSTTAVTAGPINVCGTVDHVEDAATFARIRVLHGENGVLVDRTSSSDFATRRICATVNSLSPFALAMVQLQTISGHISSGGNNLAGVTVTLSGSQSGSITTDNNGNYSLTVVRGGNYTVTPSRVSFNFTPASLSFQNVNSDITNANFSAAETTVTISGRVTDGSGNGIDGVAMTLAGAGSQITTTDSSGNYSLTGIAVNGTYTLTPSRFGFTFVPPSQTFTNLTASQIANFVATPVPNPTPTPTPNEDFDDGTIGTNFTPGTVTSSPDSNNPNVTVTVQDGQLVISPISNANGSNFNGIVLVRPIDMNVTPVVSCEAVRVPPEPGTLMTFGLGNDPNNWYRFAAGTDDGLNVATGRRGQHQNRTTDTQNLFFQTNFGGNKFSTSIPFDPVAHKFWRFRFETQVQKIHFETSPDGTLWTTRLTVDVAARVNGLVAELSAGTTGPTANASRAVFDNFALSAEATSPNRIDQADFFVRQQYLDFLNREPDAGGLAYWTNQIASCGNDIACVRARRVAVSEAFFVENEFQRTGAFIYLLYKSSFNRRLTFAEFSADRGRIIEGPNIEATKLALANDFVTRPAFRAIYDHLDSIGYVDALTANAHITLSAEDRAALVLGLLTGRETRGSVLLRIAENPTFAHQEYNAQFVLMQYFGYLRRDPDEGGYLFWLDVLNNRAPNNYPSLVCAFITSAEYQLRFGSVVTVTNASCGP